MGVLCLAALCPQPVWQRQFEFGWAWEHSSSWVCCAARLLLCPTAMVVLLCCHPSPAAVGLAGAACCCQAALVLQRGHGRSEWDLRSRARAPPVPAALARTGTRATDPLNP